MNKNEKKAHVRLRAAIQAVCFISFPSVFTAAFSGVKYIFTRIGAGEAIELTSFTAALAALCVYTFVCGRFFCGFACAFGSFGDAVHALYTAACKKLKKKPLKLPEGWAKRLGLLKYAVLALIVLACFGGVYARMHGTSPWDVFSMLRAGNFALGGYIPGLILLILLMVGMCVQERFFCRFLCPMGAVFSMLPVLPLFSLCRDRENCIKGCSGCTRKCPSGIELAPQNAPASPGNCFMCLKCIDTCPKGNIYCGVPGLRGNEIWLTLMRAAALFLLFLWLGI